jgi:hypothetical protein
MCASVCPSGALHYGPREEMETLRSQSTPIHEFRFGGQQITTKVNMMVPRNRPVEFLDVTAAMHEPPIGNPIMLNILSGPIPQPKEQP